MTQPLLSVSNLSVDFRTGGQTRRIVDGVSFELRRGEMLALVGESGSGKSISALALMGLLPEGISRVSAGSAICQDGQDLLAMPSEMLRTYRGKHLSMIFQEPMTALNPVFTVGYQIGEVLKEHEGLSGSALRQRVVDLLDTVGIPAPESRFDSYPHELSGGMRQRVMIAMALACNPEILIADEPTTALDVTVQAQIMALLRELRIRMGTAVLFITHNLALVREEATRVAVMVAGQIVEEASTRELFSHPRHPYTRMLLGCVPRAGGNLIFKDACLADSREVTHSCAHACRTAWRCPLADEKCKSEPPVLTAEGDINHAVRCWHAPAATPATCVPPSAQATESQAQTPIVAVNNLRVWFPVRAGLFHRIKGYVKAVDDVTFNVMPGETMALVGESGCGKTTIGKALMRLNAATGGTALVGTGSTAVDILHANRSAVQSCRRKIQMIFQDPFSSLNPRMMIGEMLSEILDVHKIESDRNKQQKMAEALLAEVGLPAEALNRYPHQFSGGQRQRIGLARALSVQPEIVICDECTSALDVTVQAQILNLLRNLQKTRHLAYIFITHDLSVVGLFADTVAVMYLGRIVEYGRTADVFRSPLHPYTQALLSAVPTIDGGRNAHAPLSGEVPSPIAPPSGCHFNPRCPSCQACCWESYPPMTEASPGHWVACWNSKPSSQST